MVIHDHCWQLADKLWQWVGIGWQSLKFYFVLRTLLQKCPRFSLIFRAVLRLPSPSQSVMKENPRKRPSVPPNSATCIGMYGQHCEQQHCPSKLIKVKVNQNLKHLKHLKLKTLKQLWAAALSNVWTLMDNVHQGSTLFSNSLPEMQEGRSISHVRPELHSHLPCLFSCILLVS